MLHEVIKFHNETPQNPAIKLNLIILKCQYHTIHIITNAQQSLVDPHNKTNPTHQQQ